MTMISVWPQVVTDHDQAAIDAAYDALSSTNVDFKAAARKAI